MTVETGIEDAGSYINTLDDTYPASGDELLEGDNHIRGIKNCIENTFPNITGAVTSTHTELNILDGVTATTAELNILDGVTATAAELNYNDITTLGLSEASKTVTADANGLINVPTGKGIGDANGNEAIIVNTTASAVTYVDVTNGATGNGPTIASAGETNTDINISSAGTGAVNIDAPSSGNIVIASSSGDITLNGIIFDKTPAFAAYRNASYAYTAGNDVIFDTENYDITSDYDTSTGRFTPSVAGKYQITAHIQGSGATDLLMYMYKNGSLVATTAAPSIGVPYGFISRALIMNGTTDYVTIRFLTSTIAGGGNSYFEGFRIQA